VTYLTVIETGAAVRQLSNIHGQHGINRNCFCSFALKKYSVVSQKKREDKTLTCLAANSYFEHFKILFPIANMAVKFKTTIFLFQMFY